MELVERYLHAVGFWLPKQQKQDILAELSEDIQSQVEERESGLGRSLSETEIEAILKQHGRPVLVATRFLPQQYLIGPVLFPVYRLVLKIVLLCYLVPSLLVWGGLMLLNPTYRAEHTSNGWLAAIGALWGPLWITTLIAVGAVTLVFAVIERAQAKSRFLENWNPRKLPAVPNPNLIPRSGSSLELAANLSVLVWLTANLSSLTLLNRPDIRITLSPVWTYFYWGFVLLTVGNTALSLCNLIRPYWTGLRATLRLASDCIGSALFCLLLKAYIVSGIVLANVAPERAVDITNAINLWMSRGVPFAVIVGVVIALCDLYRFYRIKTRNVQLAKLVSPVEFR